jgi:hypothetical protein
VEISFVVSQKAGAAQMLLKIPGRDGGFMSLCVASALMIALVTLFFPVGTSFNPHHECFRVVIVTYPQRHQPTDGLPSRLLLLADWLLLEDGVSLPFPLLPLAWVAPAWDATGIAGSGRNDRCCEDVVAAGAAGRVTVPAGDAVDGPGREALWRSSISLPLLGISASLFDTRAGSIFGMLLSCSALLCSLCVLRTASSPALNRLTSGIEVGADWAGAADPTDAGDCARGDSESGPVGTGGRRASDSVDITDEMDIWSSDFEGARRSDGAPIVLAKRLPLMSAWGAIPGGSGC